MSVGNIDVIEAISSAEKLLLKDKKISSETRSMMMLMIMIIKLLVEKLGKNSRNSHKPPSEEKNKKLLNQRKKSGLKQGGQKGHVGSTLEKVPEPDVVEEYPVEACESCKRNLAHKSCTATESRQVFDIKVSIVVTEHRAEVKDCPCGKRNVGKFPEGVTKSVQYGSSVKALACYLMQSQLIPYNRVQQIFQDKFKLPISAGSLSNFNQEAFNRLNDFENFTKDQLLSSKVNNADETGIRVEKKTIWLHCISNEKWTFFYPHVKRGQEAMDEMGVLANYKGILIHDHWKAYFKYLFEHGLCNAHHVRELEWCFEFESQRWAKKIQKLLLEINDEKNKRGKVSQKKQNQFTKRYRTLLTKGEKECPYQEKPKGKRGKTKKSKSRNLLERLRNFETETLLFMRNPAVPFTNNQGERDLRMTKVQQKISGCFRSKNGAKYFCRIRSFLSSGKKQGHSPFELMQKLFSENNWNFDK